MSDEIEGVTDLRLLFSKETFNHKEYKHDKKIEPVLNIRYLRPIESGFRDKKGEFIKCKCGEKAIHEIQFPSMTIFYCNKCLCGE